MKQAIAFTKEGLEKIQLEEKELLSQRPQAVAQLKMAREMGDLSENGFYKGARQKLSQIDSRLRHLHHLIKSAQIVAKTSTDIVEIGCSVTVETNGQATTFAIVGGYESNPLEGRISHKSPLGSALMGKRVSQTVEVVSPRATTIYKIVEIK